MQYVDVLIAGGGLAGFTSALHLARAGLSVLVIEKDKYPRHKVCGEYLSAEILPYLESLEADPSDLSPVRISQFECSFRTGRSVRVNLPLGGMGISRYALDQFLYKRAMDSGSLVIRGRVCDIRWQEDHFEVLTDSGSSFFAKIVLGAFGKRSSLDIKLSRRFMNRDAPWLAVKGHYTGHYPDSLVSLHHFDGGYCGISKVENDIINVCYLVNLQSFNRYKNIDVHREAVLCRNPALKAAFQRMESLFAHPVSISQVSFAPKDAVEQHILMIGDAAGLIHPFCGNGMAMAMHSAKIAADLSIRFMRGVISREGLEVLYVRKWNAAFRQRMRWAGKIAALLHRESSLALLSGVISAFPRLLPVLIRKTHGKIIKIDNYATGYSIQKPGAGIHG